MTRIRSDWYKQVEKNKDKILKVAKDLKDLDEELTYQSPIIPITSELALTLTRARLELLGLIEEFELNPRKEGWFQ